MISLAKLNWDMHLTFIWKRGFFKFSNTWGKNIKILFLICKIYKTTLVSNSTDNSIQWMTYQADFSNKHNKMISWMRMEKRLFRLNNVTTMFQIHFDLDGKTETKRIITRTVATALLLTIEAWMSLSWNSLLLPDDVVYATSQFNSYVCTHFHQFRFTSPTTINQQLCCFRDHRNNFPALQGVFKHSGKPERFYILPIWQVRMQEFMLHSHLINAKLLKILPIHPVHHLTHRY